MKKKPIFSKSTQTTRIRIETHESRTVHSGREQNADCETCGCETRHLPVAEMASFLAVSEKAVFRLAESDQVRSTETDEGRLLICLSCATRVAERRGKQKDVLYLAEAS